MKNFTISLGIGLNMFIQEYFAIIDHSQEVPISWSIKFLSGIGLNGKVR
ncbi:hypothetical protein [Pedobacter antarcticus]|nr:hypothetical protein [Pedobacter antarcticus]